MIEGRFLWSADGDPLATALRLPSFAAAELERKRGFDPSLVDDAERFAMSDYLIALAGPPLLWPSADVFCARVSALTGIPQQMLSRTRGFVGDIYTTRSAGEGKVVSPYNVAYSVADSSQKPPPATTTIPSLTGSPGRTEPLLPPTPRMNCGFKPI